MPLRLTILHLAQRFRTDGETFMIMLLTNFRSLHSQVFDYTRSSLLRLDYTKCTEGLQNLCERHEVAVPVGPDFARSQAMSPRRSSREAGAPQRCFGLRCWIMGQSG